MSENSVMGVLKEIDQLPILSVAAIRATLSCDLRDVREDSSVLRVYEGSSKQWKHIELRVLDTDRKTGTMLILAPAAPVSMKAIVAEFGKEPPFSPSSPHAGAAAGMSYDYKRPNGQLRVTFKDFQHDGVDSIIFDRIRKCL